MHDGFGLETYNLKKTFSDVIALNGVDMKIPTGRIIGLLGQNGAGKSTLVRLLSGVMKPTSGTANIRGFDLIKDSNEVKRITGLLPEEYALYEKLSIYEYIQFIATLYDVPDDEFNERLNQLINKLDLDNLKNRLIETLSKGQKQKVAFIASIIHEPLVLFLDEPMANLDVQAQRVVRKIILNYKTRSRIILIATHLLQNVQAICDDIIVIDKGEIIYSGPILDFQGDAANLEDAYLNQLSIRTG